jgi:hypothetical protein
MEGNIFTYLAGITVTAVHPNSSHHSSTEAHTTQSLPRFSNGHQSTPNSGT